MRALKIAAVTALVVLAVLVAGLASVRIPREVPIADASTVVVYSPHPDDETYAMGQAVATQALAGKRVVGVLVTDGEGSGRVPEWIEESGRDFDGDGDIDKWDFGLARREEYARAMKALGAEELVYLGASSSQGLSGFRDGELATASVEPALRAVIESIDGEVAHFALMKYLPEHRFVGDARLHPDHSGVCDAVRDIAATRGEQSLYFKVYVLYYQEWWKRWSPIAYRGPAEALERKREAVEAYREIGGSSTPELWDAAAEGTVEYAVTPGWF